MASPTAYSINILNDGSGNYSIAAFRNPSTVASGGTTITQPSCLSPHRRPRCPRPPVPDDFIQYVILVAAQASKMPAPLHYPVTSYST